MGRLQRSAASKRLSRKSQNIRAYKKKRGSSSAQEDVVQPAVADMSSRSSCESENDIQHEANSNGAESAEIVIDGVHATESEDESEDEFEDESEGQSELELQNKEDKIHDCISDLGQLAIDECVTEQVLGRFLGWVCKYSPELGFLLPKDPRTVKQHALRKHRSFTTVTANYLYIGIK
jgi:hypothetical protein